jgi:hypothetical protein
MGINDKNLATLEWVFDRYKIRSVLELGAQIFYQNYKILRSGIYANNYYKLKGVESYKCIDLNGENGAINLDLTVPHVLEKVDLVTDFGTSEHIAGYDNADESETHYDGNNTWKNSTQEHAVGVEAFYNCWTTKYNASKLLILSSNPATGHWKGHGHFYHTTKFYTKLCKLTGMKPVVLEEHFAMGNTTDGKEVCCALDVRGSHWITLEEFKAAYQYIYPV